MSDPADRLFPKVNGLCSDVFCRDKEPMPTFHGIKLFAVLRSSMSENGTRTCFLSRQVDTQKQYELEESLDKTLYMEI